MRLRIPTDASIFETERYLPQEYVSNSISSRIERKLNPEVCDEELANIVGEDSHVVR